MSEAPKGSDGYRAAKQPHDFTTSEGDPLDSRSDKRDFAALICGITMSDTSFGITYGRRTRLCVGRKLDPEICW
jgi:hypothetical protein